MAEPYNTYVSHSESAINRAVVRSSSIVPPPPVEIEAELSAPAPAAVKPPEVVPSPEATEDELFAAELAKEEEAKLEVKAEKKSGKK